MTLPHTLPRPSRLRECMVADNKEASLHDDIPTGQYLENLRQKRVSRPTGSRPPPPSKISSLRRAETAADLTVATTQEDTRPQLPSSNSMPIMPRPKPETQRIDSVSSIRSPFVGRALARPPSALSSGRDTPTAADDQVAKKRASMQYVERGTRWMERQETKSIRQAMEDMDLEKEQKIHDDARDEAADLVWKHQNPGAAFANPDAAYPNPDVKRDYRSHLRKGSYQRSHSQEIVPVVGQRSVSGSSAESAGSAKGSLTTKRRSMDILRKISPPTGTVSIKKTRTPSGKSFGGLAEAVADDIAKAHRRTSSGSRRMLSGEKKMFMHPNDKIWEDPAEGTPGKEQMRDAPAIPPPSQPASVRKNPFARVRMQAEKLERTRSEPIISQDPPRHSVEIQRNPPSQSRNAGYMSNAPVLLTPPGSRDQPSDEVSPKDIPTKEGREIRGDDIRSATSKTRGDYSPKLPRPTMVSDKPGRPIVSFQQDWRPKEIRLEEVHTAAATEPKREPCKAPQPPGMCPVKPPSPMTNIPRINVDEAPKPPIPTINLPDDPEPAQPAIPAIVLPEEPDFANSSVPKAPSINIEPPSISVQAPSVQDSRNPSPTRASGRPLPHHAATSPIPKSTPHYTPSVRQSSALCAHCALPIAGRILSAAGQRFHPACFVCHQCHTNLELVAFYPEPASQHSNRLSRIEARADGFPIPDQFNLTEHELLQQEFDDGTPAPRFYCHLDFHELFSPRCKSCKTPIEGEVIVACGAEWHAGHFFCAQCGDPFDASTPFVEKEGYAWCVGCHTNRYSSKCRGCRKPVTETVVKALGSDWHAACFVCVVSKVTFFYFSIKCLEVMGWLTNLALYRSAKASSKTDDTFFAASRRTQCALRARRGD